MERDPFFNLSLDLLCVAGLDGYFRKVNPTFTKELGYTEAELTARPFLDFVHPEDQAATVAALDELSKGADVVNFGNRYRCKDGSYRWLEWSCPAPAPGSDTVYAVARDITSRLQIQKELEEAKKASESATRAKSEFLANVSHEIRTPLNAIVGVTELLDNTMPTSQQREYLGMIHEASQSLLRLLNDVLDVSKIEAGKLELESIGFRLREVVGRTAQTLAVEAADKGLELHCRVSPDLPDRLVGDPGRIRQILMNLVGNAIKFTEKGEVLVEVNEESHNKDNITMRFDVIDTGIGIAPDKQKDVFNAFSQADASTTRRYGGTGLGLAIVSHLVELMGGRISLESELGKGTTFRFTASFALPEEKVLPASEPLSIAGQPVLVVDDNATNRRILAEILASWDMEAVLAEGSETALVELRRAADDGQPFRAVLLDCMMPGTDGFELAEHINGDPSLGAPALIMMSSAGLPEHADRSRRIGIARYMTKPIVQSDLLEALVAELGETPRGAGSSLGEAGRSGKGPGLRILVAEDNVINQRVALGLLEAHGHRVALAKDGREAVEMWQKNQFDVILMDVEMPVMDGLEAASVIRDLERQHGGHAPIIAMTAAATREDADRCRRAGMDDHIAKPVEPERLYGKVDRIARRLWARRMTEVDVETSKPARGSARTKSRKVIDLDVAYRRIPGGRRGVRELAKLMLAECPRLMKDIEDGHAEGDAERVRRGAHSIRNSADVFAAEQVVAAARRLEDIGRGGDLAGAKRAVTRLGKEVDRLTAAIRAALG